MNQPTLPVAVLVGSSEKIAQPIRLELARHSLSIRYEFANARLALERLPMDQPEKTFFFFEVRSAADIIDLERLSSAFPGFPIAAILAYPHGDRAVVEAMRAGAAQVIPYPMERDDLASAINRLLIQYGHHHPLVRTIAVCGVHGGVGTTTISLNLAYEIATAPELKLRCLIGESTRAAGTISSFLGLNPRYTTKDLLEIGGTMDLDVLKRTLTQILPKLYLMPAPREGTPRIATDEEYRLLQRLVPQLVDVVVVDFKYVNNETILRRIAECDHYLLVANQNVPSLDSLKTVRDLFRAKFEQSSPMLVINAFHPANKELSIEAMEKVFGSPAYTIRDDTRVVKQALDAGEFLRDTEPDSVALQDIRKLARVVLNLPAESKKQHGLFDFLWGRINPSGNGNSQKQA